MQPLGPAPKPLSPKQLLSLPAIRDLSEAATDPQFEMERTVQINKGWRNWRMVKGEHFLAPGFVDAGGTQIVDWVNVGGDSESGDSKLLRPVNVIGGDMYKFVAVLGNSAPRVKAVSDDPEDPDSIEKSKNAEACLRDLWEKWKADQQQRVMAFHQYTTSASYWRTQWVQDRVKYGQTVEPNVQLQDDPNGGPQVPIEGPPQTYVNGDVELHHYTIFEINHPYMARNLGECAYFNCEVLRNKWDLLALYGGQDGQPGPLDQYRTSEPPDDDQQQSASSLAGQAAEAVASPSGTGRPKRASQWRHRETWFQPFLYEAIEDPEIRQIFKTQFPDGLYLAKVGSIPVAIENRKLTDEWAVCKTGRGEKIIEEPVCNDSVPIQQTINDLVGLAVETVLRAIAKTIVDSQLLDRESLRKNEGAPAEIVLTAMPADGSDLSKHIAQINPARLSDQVVPLINLMRTTMQDISSVKPELTGGGEPTQTYREAKQRKDQGLMGLSPQSQEMDYCWQQIGNNGVKMRAKYGSGTIKVPRKGSFGAEVDTVDMADLATDGWHTEADDNFPMNDSDRFDKIWALLKEFPPEVQQQLSILDPINLEETLELLQIPGYNSVSEEQKKKTLADIMQLMSGQVVTGPDGTSQPSLPIDQFDDHAFVADFCRKWMVATAAKSRVKSPDGFANVQAWQQAHQQAANPPAPPPPPPVRAALNASVKLEDMPPDFANEILQGAGLPPLPAMPPPAVPPPGAPQPPAGGPPQPGAPAPPETTAAKAAPAMPPLADIAAGPTPPPTVQ